MTSGLVSDVFRFPVKSMQGEALQEAEVREDGVSGDRAWAVRDERIGEITSAKRSPRLLQCSAQLTERGIEVALPGEGALPIESPQLPEALSKLLKIPVSLHPQRGERAHYRLGQIRTPARTRQLLGVSKNGPLPDMSQFSWGKLVTLMLYATPPGSYVDAYPIHIVSLQGMRALSERLGEPVSAARFRPNFVVDLPHAQGEFPEHGLVGSRIRLGEVVMEVKGAAFRCGMTSHAQSSELPKLPRLTKEIYHRLDSKFGVYAEVVRTGVVRVGDSVVIEETKTRGAGFGNGLKRLLLDTYLRI